MHTSGAGPLPALFLQTPPRGAGPGRAAWGPWGLGPAVAVSVRRGLEERWAPKRRNAGL